MVQKDTVRGKTTYDRESRTENARWVVAEQEICRLLTPLLSDGCLILNNVPYPYGNLDHVVVRPDGIIFLIETKSHEGNVTWDGKHLLINRHRFSSNPISQINRGIRWIRSITEQLFRRKPWIVSVLVFPNAQIAFGRSVKRVIVKTGSDLVNFIRTYRPR